MTLECDEIAVVARDFQRKSKQRRIVDSSTKIQNHSLDHRDLNHQPAVKVVPPKHTTSSK